MSDDEVIGRLAARVAQWGLADLAVLALDALRPLAPLAGQALWVAQPTLGLLVNAQDIGALAGVLERPGGAECLRRGLQDARRSAGEAGSG